MTPPEMTRVLREVRARLEGAHVNTAEREAQWILEAATGLSRAELLLRPEISNDESTRALDMAARRVAGEPLQYITGIAAFRHLDLEVGPGVFIPRPETELVAERAMDLAPPSGTLVELGTGSGAIALASAHERPDLSVWGTEVSHEALGWATRNRDRLGLDVDLVQADLFDGLPTSLRGEIDVIVSNPPYVPEGFNLPDVVADHEPHVALFAADDGLRIIDQLVADAREWLRPGGWLVLEIGEVQRSAVRRILEEAGYRDVDVRLDMSQRPRIAEARL